MRSYGDWEVRWPAGFQRRSTNKRRFRTCDEAVAWVYLPEAPPLENPRMFHLVGGEWVEVEVPDPPPAAGVRAEQEETEHG